MNLQLGKIYKVMNIDTGEVYFGSTCERLLCNRMSKYRASKRRFNNVMGDISKCKIYLVENYPCETKEELLRRERFYIENFPCKNKNIPSRTKAEYYKQNREKMLLKAKIKRLEKKIKDLTTPPPPPSPSPEVEEQEDST